jgi:NAD(P)-dependent dehydrogenase (short-subunit alcohol dehydrogenase family)
MKATKSSSPAATARPGEELVQELRELGAEAEFICADVRHDDEMRNLIDQTVERFGRLDAAVNNAGTEGHPGPVTEQTPDSFAAVFDTNVLGTLLGLKHEMRVMAKQGGGSIVNLSSVLGKVGAPNAAVYTASKHAVEGLTKAAALEGAAIGVRVNAVAPGPVETEMLNRFTGGGERKENFLESVPVKRAATPQEIADTILFLACKAPFLTGQSIVVDGGKTAA